MPNVDRNILIVNKVLKRFQCTPLRRSSRLIYSKIEKTWFFCKFLFYHFYLIEEGDDEINLKISTKNLRNISFLSTSTKSIRCIDHDDSLKRY